MEDRRAPGVGLPELVAVEGIEPPTSGLWVQRAATAPHRHIWSPGPCTRAVVWACTSVQQEPPPSPVTLSGYLARLREGYGEVESYSKPNGDGAVTPPPPGHHSTTPQGLAAALSAHLPTPVTEGWTPAKRGRNRPGSLTPAGPRQAPGVRGLFPFSASRSPRASGGMPTYRRWPFPSETIRPSSPCSSTRYRCMARFL
jgi:hypothetical protein